MTGGEAPVSLRDWVLVYTRAGERVAWLVVEGVPAALKRADVMDALEAWRRWPAFAPGPAGRLSLVPMDKLGSLDLPAVQPVPWSDLAPASVRTTVELPGDVHAAVVRAARRAGVSQATWIVRAVAAAAGEV